jgi:mannosyltransferase
LARANSSAVWLIPGVVAWSVGWWGIAAADISRDETATIGISTRSVPDIWRMSNHFDAVHTLYYLIMHFWTKAFGVSPVALRLPSLISMTIAAALLAALGRMLVSPRAGFTAGLLYACAPQVSYYAHDARSYAIDSTLVILLFVLFVRALRASRRRAWIWYALVLAVTVVMHLFTVLVVAAQAVTVLLGAASSHSWRAARRWLVATGLALCALAPFVVAAAGQADSVGWIAPFAWTDVWGFILAIAGRASLIAPFAILAVLAIRISTKRPTVMAVALPWLIVPPVLLFGVSAFDHLYLFRYLLYCLPALALLAAAGLDRFRGWQHAIVLVALIGLTIPQQLNVRNPDQGANDFRAEAAFIQTHKQPNDAIFFVVPTQRPLKNSDPDAYAGLNDIALARTPAEAANFSGDDLPPGLVQQRLDTADRVWAVRFWVSQAQAASVQEVERQQYAMLRAAGLRLESTTRFRGGVFRLYVRQG